MKFCYIKKYVFDNQHSFFMHCISTVYFMYVRIDFLNKKGEITLQLKLIHKMALATPYKQYHFLEHNKKFAV